MADALSHHDTKEVMVLAIFGPGFDFIDRLCQAHVTDLALVAIKVELMVG